MFLAPLGSQLLESPAHVPESPLLTEANVSSLRLDSESLCWTKGWENSEGTMLPAEEVSRQEKSEEGEKQGLRKKRRPSDPEEDWLSRALSIPVLTRNKGPLTHFKGEQN